MEHLSTLKVTQLKEQLLVKGKDAKGGKAALVARLRDALEEEGLDPETFVKQLDVESITPQDSASQVVSRVSKGSSRTSVSGTVVLKQLDEAATQASLEAKAKRLRERQDIDRKLAELERQREMLELEEAIEMSKARGKVLTEFSKVNVEQTQFGTYQSECRDSAQFGQLNSKSDPGPML